MSRPSRGAWIEIEHLTPTEETLQSRPSRGAWIEISFCSSFDSDFLVAPLAGRVD